MSTSNENEPEKSSAPADPGPPEWLTAANASQERARSLFPKSTIGQTPRSTIGLPPEPAAPADSAPPVADTVSPKADTVSPTVDTVSPAADTVSPTAETFPAAPDVPAPAAVEPAEASHPYLPYTAPLTPAASPATPSAAVTPSRDAVRPRTPGVAMPSVPTPAPAYSQDYATTAAAPGKGLSLASMILGSISVVLTIFWLGFLPALAAIITGHLAQRRQPTAKVFWMTGLITGYLGLVFSTILIVWIVAIFMQAYTAAGAGL